MDKHIYLDVDMDYFVSPIEKVSVDNVRLYQDRSCETAETAALVKKLRAHGLSWGGDKISCFTNHKTSYTHWWITKKQDNILVHIDAHSDLYRNSYKDLRKLPNSEIGCYNYIWYGIRDGFIGAVYWVIPESISDMMELQNAPRIINEDLTSGVTRDEGGLHILMECIVVTGEVKQIPVHVCTVDMLPRLDAVCDKVTLATSPEFIPAAADELVYDYIDSFGAPKETAHNIYKQHKAMLEKTPEEIQEAWEKVNKKGF